MDPQRAEMFPKPFLPPSPLLGFTLDQNRMLESKLKRENISAELSGTPSDSNNDFDHLSVIVYCPTGVGISNEYFLQHSEKGLTLPGVKIVKPDESWNKIVEELFVDADLPTIQVNGITRLDRWYVPGQNRFSSHAVFSASALPELKDIISEKFVGYWASVADVRQFLAERKLVSPDLFQTLLRLEMPEELPVAQVTEQTAANLFVDITKAKKSGFEQLIQSAQFGRNVQERLYQEFLDLTTPFIYLGFNAFSNFMKTLGWSESCLVDLFRTFDTDNKGGLSYRDFLSGLAAVDPVTQHGGPPAELRCRYIFRYYDQNNDGQLNYEEFRQMVADIRKKRGLNEEPTAIQIETERSARVFGNATSENLSIAEFLTGVGQLKFRGTSGLLRSPTSITMKLKSVAPGFEIKIKSSRIGVDPISITMEEDLSNLGQEEWKTYDIATHSVRVRRSGTVLLDIHSLWEIEHSGITGQEQNSTLLVGSAANRTQSFDTFNQDSQPNEMLNGLKYFERLIPKDTKSTYKPKPPFDWGEVDRTSLAKCIINLCLLVKDLLSAEPRLVELAPPVYILGDIHGNYPDLICFEKALWRLGPILTPATFLFLGDYVDRGIYGVEVISYLFAQKVLAPVKFNLLRGNHEIREVQQMFTFHRECLTKFGDKVGQEVWDAINAAFDCMPLAAVVDKKIFCAHGGIPPPWLGGGMTNVVNTIPCPLAKPDQQSPLAWELMWSDPIHVDLLTVEQQQSFNLSMIDGFGVNPKRGTAHVFSAEALYSFLTRNSLSHVVRAHEVQQAGFQVQFGGKLLTVFSSSKYCGGSNEAACILADKYKLRTIRIDTA